MTAEHKDEEFWSTVKAKLLGENVDLDSVFLLCGGVQWQMIQCVATTLFEPCGLKLCFAMVGTPSMKMEGTGQGLMLTSQTTAKAFQTGLENITLNGKKLVAKDLTPRVAELVLKGKIDALLADAKRGFYASVSSKTTQPA